MNCAGGEEVEICQLAVEILISSRLYSLQSSAGCPHGDTDCGISWELLGDLKNINKYKNQPPVIKLPILNIMSPQSKVFMSFQVQLPV